jgi:hypothetical protein
MMQDYEIKKAADFIAVRIGRMEATQEIYRGIQMLLARRFARGDTLDFVRSGDAWTLS